MVLLNTAMLYQVRCIRKDRGAEPHDEQPDHLLAVPECSTDHGGLLADEHSEVPY